ncbi:tenectin [Anticarsia gemmatalis]|uniref:tenectin n=1 Tax=Anticarsia gemmatalis TaxID=129554 RepID=UPI003F76C4D1
MDRRRAAGALLALAACIACSAAAPTASNQTSLDLYDGAPEGCYYNFQHYGEGDRIMTNEPCLNCTCHNRMLMCYLRVCPFTKPIGQDCTVEKRADQCCPIVTCPDVPVDLLTSTSTTSPAEYGATGLGKLDKYGCSINGKYFPEGSKVPPTPNKPCEHCYCIRNMTTCVMQECTLHVDGCTPIYHKDVCCPVRYSCDHPEDEMPLLDDMSTTVRPTPGFLLTTTTLSPVTQMTQDCVHNDQIIADGASITTEKACEHCYCMKGDIVCVVQECGAPMENEGKNCTSMPPREGQCCPDTYMCEGENLGTEPSTDSILDKLTTLLPPRRGGVEGSGYRIEPNEVTSYTEMPTVEPEIEGSGEDQEPTKATDMHEQEKPLEPEEVDQYIPVTSKSPSYESESTTEEIDRNVIPEDMVEKETVEPYTYLPTTQAPASDDMHKSTPEAAEGDHKPHEYDTLTTATDIDHEHEHKEPHDYRTSTATPFVDEGGATIPYEIDTKDEITLSPISEGTTKPELASTSSDEIEKQTTEKSEHAPEPITEKESLEPESDIAGTTSAIELGDKTTVEPEIPHDTYTEKDIPELHEYAPTSTSVPVEDIGKLTTEPDHAQNTVADEDSHHPHVPHTEEEQKTTAFDIEAPVTHKATEADIGPYEQSTTQVSLSEPSEQTTAEPDKGLNTIPSEKDEESSSQPSLIDRTVSVLETKTTEPSVIIDTKEPHGDESTYPSSSESILPTSESHITKVDQYTITTEPSPRKDDEYSVSTEKLKEEFGSTTIKPEFVDEGFIPTSTHDEKGSSGPDAPSVDEEITTVIPELEESVGTKEPATETISDDSDIAEKPAETTSEQVGLTSASTEKSTEDLVTPETHEEPSRIPGEGDCLVNGVTYGNNTAVPSTNNCLTNCKCASSIVKCDPIICSPPPDYMDNCQPIHDTLDSCCPAYKCEDPRKTAPPQSDNQMSGTESPMPRPTIECRGDQCELTEATKQPLEPTELCTSGSCDHKPETGDCGPEGCKHPTKEPSISTESCAGGECHGTPSHDHKIPVESCEGPDCKATSEEKPLPQLCENEEECKKVELPATETGPCEGTSCVKVDCESGNCDSNVISPPHGIDECKEEGGCKPQEISPTDCTGDEPCRRKDTPVPGYLPAKCEGNECTQQSGSTKPSEPEQTTLAEQEITEKPAPVEDGDKIKPHPADDTPSEEETATKVPTAEEEEHTGKPALVDEEGTKAPYDSEEQQTHKPALVDDEGTKAPHVVEEEHTGKPGLVAEEHTKMPYGIEEEQTDRPALVGEEDAKIPHVDEDEHTSKPASADEEGTKTPYGIEEEHTSKPALVDEEGTKAPYGTEDEYTGKPALVDEEGTKTPHDAEEEQTGKPILIDEEGTKAPYGTEDEHTGKPALVDEEGTKAPYGAEEEHTRKPVLIDEEGTKAPYGTEDEHTGKPALVDEEGTKAPYGAEEEHTRKPVLIDEEGTKAPYGTDDEHTGKPALVDEEGTKAPYGAEEEHTGKPDLVDEEGTKAPYGIEDEHTDKPALVDEEGTKTPYGAEDEHTGKPALADEEGTKAPYGAEDEHTGKPALVDEEGTKAPYGAEEEHTRKPALVDEEATKAPHGVEEDETGKPALVDEEGTKAPYGTEEEHTGKPALVDEEGTKAPYGTEEEHTGKPALVDEERTEAPHDVGEEDTKTPHVDEEEHISKPTSAVEEGTKAPYGAEEEHTGKPDLVDEEGTKAPYGAEEEHTGKPDLVDEEGTKAPYGVEDEHTDKPALVDEEGTKTPYGVEEEHTGKPALVDEEGTKAPYGAEEEHTRKPTLVEEEGTKPSYGVEEEHTGKPALVDEEGTKSPYGGEEEYTSKPELIDEDVTKAPHGVEEEHTGKPAIVDEEGTKAPYGTEEDHTGKPALVDEDGTKVPSGDEDEHTGKPALIDEEATKAPHGVEEEHTGKPVLIDEEGTKAPYGVEEEHTGKPALVDEEATKTPYGVEEEHTRKPALVDEEGTKTPYGIEEEHTGKPALVDEEGTKAPYGTEDEHTGKPALIDEEGTKAPYGDEDEHTGKPALVDEESTKTPYDTEEEHTGKPVSVDEEGTKAPYGAEEEHTGKPALVDEEGTKAPYGTDEEHTGKPASVDEEGTKAPYGAEDEHTGKPALVDEEGTKAPLVDEEEHTSKPASADEEGTKAPYGTEDEHTGKPVLVDEEGTRAPYGDEEEHTHKPALVDEEGTKTPHGAEEEHTGKPALVDEDESKTPYDTEEEHTGKPALVDEEITKAPHGTEEDHTGKPALVDEEGTKTPYGEEHDHTGKPALVDEERRPVEEEHTDEPIVDGESGTKIPDLKEHTDKPILIEEDLVNPDDKVEEHTGKPTFVPDVTVSDEKDFEETTDKVTGKPVTSDDKPILVEEDLPEKPALTKPEEDESHIRDGEGTEIPDVMDVDSETKKPHLIDEGTETPIDKEEQGTESPVITEGESSSKPGEPDIEEGTRAPDTSDTDYKPDMGEEQQKPDVIDVQTDSPQPTHGYDTIPHIPVEEGSGTEAPETYVDDHKDITDAEIEKVTMAPIPVSQTTLTEDEIDVRIPDVSSPEENITQGPSDKSTESSEIQTDGSGTVVPDKHAHEIATESLIKHEEATEVPQPETEETVAPVRVGEGEDIPHPSEPVTPSQEPHTNVHEVTTPEVTDHRVTEPAEHKPEEDVLEPHATKAPEYESTSAASYPDVGRVTGIPEETITEKTGETVSHVEMKPDQTDVFTPEKEEMITSTVVSAVTEPVKGFTEIEDSSVTGQEESATDYYGESTERVQPSASTKADETSETLPSSSVAPDAKITKSPEESYTEAHDGHTEAPELGEATPSIGYLPPKPEASTILPMDFTATESQDLTKPETTKGISEIEVTELPMTADKTTKTPDLAQDVTVTGDQATSEVSESDSATAEPHQPKPTSSYDTPTSSDEIRTELPYSKATTDASLSLVTEHKPSDEVRDKVTEQQEPEIHTEGPEAVTKLADVTSSPAEFSETTPYLIELEEHTHKIVDEASSVSPFEEDTTPSLSEEEHISKTTVHPATASPSVDDYTHKLPEDASTASPSIGESTSQPEGDLQVSSEKIPEEETATKQAEIAAGPHDESSTIPESSTPEQVSDKHPESLATTEGVHSVDTTVVPSADLDKHDVDHKEVTTSTEKSPISDSDTALPTEKETLGTDKPLYPHPHLTTQETMVPEEEFIFSTTKATTLKQEEIPSPISEDKIEEKPTSEVIPPSTTRKPATEPQPTHDIPSPDEDLLPSGPTGPGYGETDYGEEDQAFGPGTCRYGGKVYVSAQQIPRDDPCDFCFCFRSDIICLQQSCPPPIHGCHEEPIQGFCCPRYECPVSMATTVNVTTTTTTTTTTLPPHFPTHPYKRGAVERTGCQIRGHTYKVGEVVRSSSGPCLHCTCGGDGQMKCDPKACTPEPMLRQMIAAAVSAKRRR